MGDPRRSPGFGQIDLDLADDPNEAEQETAPAPSAFGEVDFDLGESDEPPPPPSTSRVFNHEKRATRRNIEAQAAAVRASYPEASARPSSFPSSVHDESTRIVRGDALSAITRPPPAASPLADDGNTRAWAEVDEALLLVGVGKEKEKEEDKPVSSRNGNPPAPSGSGVATRDGRVAAMRDLYARGDADGALALAATLGQTVAPPAGSDHPDASIVVEFGEQSIDLSDPFGGLIPLEDELAATATVSPPPITAGATTTAPPAGPAAHLTLTERQSIPRVLKSLAQVSKLKIDHRAGFLLAHVDGMQTLEEILDICAMPPAEALELIASLKEMGVIEFD